MMLCPVCGRSYEAGTLYCMDDGAALGPAGPPPSASGELGRLLTPAAPLAVAPPVAAAAPLAAFPPAASRGGSGGLVAVVAVLGVLVVGMLGVVLWQQQQTAQASSERADAAEARAAEARRAAETAAADAEAAEQDRADADARAERAASARDAEPAGGTTTVWANSPGDGFLALRSGPTTASGTRLLKIPHGDPLSLGSCLPPTTTPGGRYGAWCRAVYGGTSGWVFDAFVSR